MGQPDPVAALARTVARHETLFTAQRGQIAALAGRLDAAQVEVLAGRFEDLAGTVAAALDAAAPKGPPVPRWDIADQVGRDKITGLVREWVEAVLRPAYLRPAGCYDLAGCWAGHPMAVMELGVLAAQWRHVWDRDRPGPAKDAGEWHDRWLPGCMRRAGEVTRNCTPQCVLRAGG